VHMTGGVAAIVGAAVVGPRKGRFDGGKPVDMPGHSATLQVLGTFILWVGWYGFNPGSTLGLSAEGYTLTAARCVITTTLSAGTAGLFTVLLDKTLGSKVWSVGAVCNGILAGLVSITAGCSVTYPWHAVMIGMFGAFVYFGTSNLVLKVLKIDDPLDAFAVHGMCGFWGVIATALFSVPAWSYNLCGGVGAFWTRTWAEQAAAKEWTIDPVTMAITFPAFCDASYSPNQILFVTALAFLFSNILWTGGLSAIMFLILKVTGMLRVSAEMEEAGMDVSKHGGTAYQ